MVNQLALLATESQPNQPRKYLLYTVHNQLGLG